MTGSITRIPLVLGNWKMHTNLDEAVALSQASAAAAIAHPDVEVGILPPAIWLVSLAERLSDSAGAMLGAQDVAAEPSGAFTGDLSAEMLAPYTRFMLAGHSERRHLHGESDEEIRTKLDAVYRVDRVPILAVGETEDERQSGRATDVVTTQLSRSLQGRTTDQLRTLVIAYEPVWAIGTGNSATVSDAEEMSSLIRAWVRELDPEASERTRILYGGSVKADNAAQYFASPDIDGGLIGGASLKPDEFNAIVAAAGSQAT